MAYHNNDDDNYQYYNNYNRSDPTNPMRQYTNYNDQGGPSTLTSTVQGLNQSRIDTGYNNNSTKSLGGATAVEEQPKRSIDEGESRSGSVSTEKSVFTQQPLIGQEFGDVEGQYYPDYNQNNQSSGYFSKYHHRNDSYYDEEATRHNTLTSGDPNAYYNFEHDYTDRDFPGGGKGARQSMTGEHLTIPMKKRKRCCACCACCSWPICLLITLIILIGLGVTAFFVLPRIPTVNIKDAIPNSQPIISSDHINLNFTIVVDIENQQNYVPYKFNQIDVSVFDNNAPTVSTPIATGTKLDYTLQPKSSNTLEFPLSVNYTSTNFKNDPVIQDFIAACSPQVQNHTLLKLRVEVTLFIWGIDWVYKPKISVPIPDMECPISI